MDTVIIRAVANESEKRLGISGFRNVVLLSMMVFFFLACNPSVQVPEMGLTQSPFFTDIVFKKE